MVAKRIAVAVLALACVPAALADRAPTASERRAIVESVRFFPAVGRQNKLTFLKVRVSTVDRRYAVADVFTRDAKGRGIGFATALLRRAGRDWRVTFFGTEIPPCGVAAGPVRRDLLHTVRCLKQR